MSSVLNLTDETNTDMTDPSTSRENKYVESENIEMGFLGEHVDNLSGVVTEGLGFGGGDEVEIEKGIAAASTEGKDKSEEDLSDFNPFEDLVRIPFFGSDNENTPLNSECSGGMSFMSDRSGEINIASIVYGMVEFSVGRREEKEPSEAGGDVNTFPLEVASCTDVLQDVDTNKKVAEWLRSEDVDDHDVEQEPFVTVLDVEVNAEVDAEVDASSEDDFKSISSETD